jgi:hypothetical protein
MGIPNDDPTRSPVPPPETRPDFDIVVKDIRTLSLPFHDQGTESRAIPYCFDGAVVRWVAQNACGILSLGVCFANSTHWSVEFWHGQNSKLSVEG